MKEKLKKLDVLKLGKELSKSQQKKVTGGNFRCVGSPMQCVQDIPDEEGYCRAVWNSVPEQC